jgi:hypothetical protein
MIQHNLQQVYNFWTVTVYFLYYNIFAYLGKQGSPSFRKTTLVVFTQFLDNWKSKLKTKNQLQRKI